MYINLGCSGGKEVNKGENNCDYANSDDNIRGGRLCLFLPLLHGRLFINFSDSIFWHNIIFCIVGVTGLFEGQCCIPTGLILEYNWSSWMLSTIVCHIVYIISNHYPQIVVFVMLSYFTPCVYFILHLLC